MSKRVPCITLCSALATCNTLMCALYRLVHYLRLSLATSRAIAGNDRINLRADTVSIELHRHN